MLDVRTCRRVVVYGGSFDPPHRAHVELPFAAARAVGADGVLFIPAGQPPHKPGRVVTDAAHRLAMLRLALGERDDAAIDTREIERQGPSYTVDTLRELRAELGDKVELRLLIGADMAAIFDQWREPERVAELAEPLVMAREPHGDEPPPAPLGEAWRKRIIKVPRMDVSSSELRRLLHDKKYDDPRVREFMHPGVVEYVKQHRLYE